MSYNETRLTVQRLCTHVVARERHARTGRIGLVWTGAGIGTDRLWVDLDGLHDADGRSCPFTTLAEAAAFADIDLAEPFSVGHDTPAVGDPDRPLAVDPADLGTLLAAFATAWPVLTGLAAEDDPDAPVTLWPEHFDAAFVWRERANVGTSAGDGFAAEPYAYVGPWGPDRPGDPAWWNAPFGAFLPVTGDAAALDAFFREGLGLLRSAAG